MTNARGPAGPTLSVIIPVRDEVRRLPTVLAGVAAQSLRPDEVIVVDGDSTDGTREWLAGHGDGVVVLRNERRIIPAALNLGIAAASGELVARMDAHADYPPDYLATLAGVLAARPDVTGAGAAMTTAGRGPWGEAIASVLSRRIGLGGARHRVGHRGGPVEHVFTGCYRRSALVAAGGYDERLSANEDYEMDHRLRAAGGLLWLSRDARTTWYVREGPLRTARQMFRYGSAKALTLRLHPGSLRARQAAPPALICGLAGLAAASRRIGPYPFAAAAAAYLGTCAVAAVRAARADGASPWRAALVPPLVHLSWGAGVLTGLVRHAHPRPALSPLRPADTTEPAHPGDAARPARTGVAANGPGGRPGHATRGERAAPAPTGDEAGGAGGRPERVTRDEWAGTGEA